MQDVYVLDTNLRPVGIIDAYKSLIWANRYAKAGDCELYLPATHENLSLLTFGNYLIRLDDDMVCKITRIEIDTNADSGNYLIVNGTDTKALLDQRVIWDTVTCDGSVEDFVREMVDSSVCTPSLSARQMKKENGSRLIYLGTKANLPDVNTEQISFKNVGDKIREICKTYNYGYKMTLDQDALWFYLYKGADRSDSVIFSDNYENLASTKYVDEKTKAGNVARIGGAGEGTGQSVSSFGEVSGIDRFEVYVDAKDVATTLTWGELVKTYPLVEDGGQGVITTDGYGGQPQYKMNQIDIQILDSTQLAWLQDNYPGGTEVTIDDIDYYRLTDVVIATLPSTYPTSSDTATLTPLLYYTYLANKGAQAVADSGDKITFEGSVIPNVTFVYKQDYFLGDIVTVENSYGISASARITEIVEVMDDSGYKMEPKFEYQEITGDLPTFLLTHNDLVLMTENGRGLTTQSSPVRSAAGDVQGIKITQLPDAGELGAGDYIPTANSQQTQKISYTDLVDQIEEDIGGGGTDDYDELTNKPSIEGVTLEGNKTFDQLNLTGITNSEIEDLPV